MRIRFLVFLLVLSVIPFHLWSLPVEIEGKSAAGDAFVFRLYQLKDPISNREILLDQERPDQDGHFHLRFETNEIRKVTIRVGLQSMSFYVQPGKSYHLDFNEITIKDQNVFLPQSPLNVVFENTDILNLVIDGFEFEYQQFLQDHFLELVKYRDANLFNEFEEAMLKKLQETPLEDSAQKYFFNQYVKYRLADISLMAQIKNVHELGFEMIDQEEIQFNNFAYNQFFLKYFDKYILDYNGGELIRNYQQSLNESVNYDALFDDMGKNKVLQREQLRELVFIYSLKQMYFLRDVKKTNIDHILQGRIENSKFKLNREVAKNVVESLKLLQVGYEIPTFAFKNQDQQLKTNTDYKGKYTYLMFVSPNCETCEADIRILKTLSPDFKDFMQVVTIYTGFNQEESKEWMQNQKPIWDFLWFDDNFSLLNDFNIKSFPKYVLLNKEGLLMHRYPPSPREDIEGMIGALEKLETKKPKKTTPLFQRN